MTTGQVSITYIFIYIKYIFCIRKTLISASKLKITSEPGTVSKRKFNDLLTRAGDVAIYQSNSFNCRKMA